MKPRQNWTEREKRSAAKEAVKIVRDDSVVGLGSGSTAAFAIEELGNRIKCEGLRMLGLPTSYQSSMLATKHKIQLTTLEEHPTLDLTIDGADQIDEKLNLIKGMGGALAREKIVASASKKLIIVADESKKVRVLGENNQPVPIEVLPFAASYVIRKVTDAGGKPVLREGVRKVGPMVTDNGNFIIDVGFGPISRPDALERELKVISGVVETGLFVKMVNSVYLGKRRGVNRLDR